MMALPPAMRPNKPLQRIQGAFFLVVLAVVAACGSDGADTAPDAGTNAATAVCVRWNEMALARGCETLTGACQAKASCSAQWHAWLDCVETDAAQCLCESSGDLNCEGSWKPNEGPAKCIAQHDALAACDDT
jgi:hypothetical protein